MSTIVRLYLHGAREQGKNMWIKRIILYVVLFRKDRSALSILNAPHITLTWVRTGLKKGKPPSEAGNAALCDHTPPNWHRMRAQKRCLERVLEHVQSTPSTKYVTSGEKQRAIQMSKHSSLKKERRVKECNTKFHAESHQVGSGGVGAGDRWLQVGNERAGATIQNSLLSHRSTQQYVKICDMHLQYVWRGKECYVNNMYTVL